MQTSGFSLAIHSLERSKPSKTGRQYGSPVLPLSHAAPTAGMCDVATPATILATALPLRLAAVALDRAPALEHHLRVLFLGRARHLGGDLLERQPVGRRELGGEIDVAAEREHAVPVALQDDLLLLLRHRPAVEIGALVRLER